MSFQLKHQFRWCDHGSSTMSSLSTLLDTGYLTDVGLTCADGVTLNAHRLVLAASSRYFHRLFRDASEPKVAVVFHTVSQHVLRDMLQFMYKGEVEVEEAHLADFLRLGETLQVKGTPQYTTSVSSMQDGSDSEPDLSPAPMRTATLDSDVVLKQLLRLTPLPPTQLKQRNQDRADFRLQMGNGHSTGLESSKAGSNQNLRFSEELSQSQRVIRWTELEEKVLSQFPTAGPVLEVVTPALKKSKRSGSLQLAIRDIMSTGMSKRAAAKKYLISEMTLGQHYRRYLKDTGIQKKEKKKRYVPIALNKSKATTNRPFIRSPTASEAIEPIEPNEVVGEQRAED